MALWCISTFLIAALLESWIRNARKFRILPTHTSSKTKTDLKKTAQLLHALEDSLLAGQSPPQEKWDELGQLAPPWNHLAQQNLSLLRSRGSPILPTLRRLRKQAESQLRTLDEAESKTAQARSQAWICGALIPVCGCALPVLLPDLTRNSDSETSPNLNWIWVCLAASAWGLLGAAWIYRLAQTARWAGLRPNEREWIISIPCAAERFLALLQSGTPVDSAWQNARDFLGGSDRLNEIWGPTLWKPADSGAALGSETTSRRERKIIRSFRDLGDSLRKSVQISLFEGKPAAERIETAISTSEASIRNAVENELSLLATRSLFPLFLFIAPGVVGLLFYALMKNAGGIF